MRTTREEARVLQGRSASSLQGRQEPPSGRRLRIIDEAAANMDLRSGSAMHAGAVVGWKTGEDVTHLGAAGGSPAPATRGDADRGFPHRSIRWGDVAAAQLSRRW